MAFMSEKGRSGKLSSSSRQGHMIDMIFPIVLFFLFTISAVCVLLLATNIYRGINERSSANHTAQTAISYVTEKIRQGDEAGGITLTEIDGETVLMIPGTVGSASYCTYIYVLDGALCELYTRADLPADLAAGNTIMSVQTFLIRSEDGRIFDLVCTDTQGSTATASVTTRSQGGDD